MKVIGHVTLFIFMIVSAELAAGQQMKIEGVAAVVENEIILYSELLFLADREAVALQIDKDRQPKEYSDLVSKWLDILLDQKAQMILAENDTLVKVEQEEIDAQVESQIQDFLLNAGSVAALEAQAQMTVQDIRDGLAANTENEILLQRLKFQVTKDVTVTRTEIDAFFSVFEDSLPPIPKTFNISHILLIPTAAPEMLAAKGGFLDSLRQLILDGADFAELAREHSEDPGSGNNGGDLGWTKPGNFFPEFENAVAELDSGEISGLVQSPVGYHIIQLLGRRGDEFDTRHILALVNVTPEDEQRTIDTLNVYRRRALDGEDFSEMAFLLSDDPDVKERRGYLDDWDLASLAERLPEFKENIEFLGEGDISVPFKTQFGYHIVKINILTEERQRDIVTDYEFISDIALGQKQNKFYAEWFAEKKGELYIDIKVDLSFSQEAQIDTGGTAVNFQFNRNNQDNTPDPEMFFSLLEDEYTVNAGFTAFGYSQYYINSQRRKFLHRQMY